MPKVDVKPSSKNVYEKKIIFNFYNMRCALIRHSVFPIFLENCRNMISFGRYMILIIFVHE